MAPSGWRPNRRAVAAGLLASGAGASAIAAPRRDPLSGAALYADVKTYAGFGDHRTGLPGDNATAEWMVRELSRVGYEAETQGFEYPVFDLARADLTLARRRFMGFPVWTPRTSPPGGVTGPLSLDGGPGRIQVISLPYSPGASLQIPGYMRPLQGAAASGAAAVVAITENPVGELVALNAEPKAEPWAVPILSVAGRDGPALLEAARAGARATLRIEGATQTRTALNVIARRTRPGKALVITTPKSGWLTCAGERGSGVAIWLGLARWLAATTQHNLLLGSTSAHEFHGHGGHVFAERAPPPKDTRFWLHIGANVAAYDFALKNGRPTRLPHPTSMRGIACSASLVPLARKAFAGQPGYEKPVDIDIEPAPGEVMVYHRRGYAPIAGLVGGHPLHHTPRDLPDVTSPQILEPVARGLQTLLREL